MRKIFRLSVLATLFALLSGLVISPATAAKDDPYDAKKKNQQQQKDNAEALEHTDEKLIEAYNKLEATKGKIADKEVELAEAENVLAEAQRTYDALVDRLSVAEEREGDILGEIEDDESRFDDARVTLAAMAREAYRGDSAPTATMALALGASTPEEFVDRLAVVDTALRAQNSAVLAIQDTSARNVNRQVRLEAIRDEIADLKEEAEEKLQIADAARDRIANAKASLEDLAATQASDADALEELRAEQKKIDAQLKKQADAIDAEIKEMVRKAKEAEKRKKAEEKRKAEQARKEAEKNNKPAPKPKPSSPSQPSSPPSSSSFAWPTNYRHVTSSYGYRFHPILGYTRLHGGVDIRAYCGTPIYTIADGTARTARLGGLGNQVLVDHGIINGRSYITSYNHLQRFGVSNGQKVKKGQLVGYSGTTGTSTACHLHLEMFIDGNRIDPMTVL